MPSVLVVGFAARMVHAIAFGRGKEFRSSHPHYRCRSNGLPCTGGALTRSPQMSAKLRSNHGPSPQSLATNLRRNGDHLGGSFVICHPGYVPFLMRQVAQSHYPIHPVLAECKPLNGNPSQGVHRELPFEYFLQFLQLRITCTSLTSLPSRISPIVSACVPSNFSP